MRKTNANAPPDPTGHPYGRISHPEQRKGGGLTRQMGADYEGFCRQFGFRLNPTTLVDDGVSAFHGLNATPDHALGWFLAEAKRGRIAPGDCLIIENYDRLSRQDPWAAMSLVNELRELGIHVGRLDRWKVIRADSTDYGDFFEAALEFMRGNSESAMKSQRNREAWRRKRKQARETGHVVTAQVPAWVRREGDTLTLIPGRAETVRRIFELAAAGYGLTRLVAKLNAEGREPFGEKKVKEGRKRSAFSGRWTVPYVNLILKDRRAVGEYQPCGAGRKPEGPPIPNYFPAAVTEDAFNAALAARAPGIDRSRIGKHVNLFTGLLVNARDGEGYRVGEKMGRVLFAASSEEGRGPAWSFPLPIFEEAFLERLTELDVASVLSDGDKPNPVAALSGELASVEAELAEVNAFLDTEGFSASVGRRAKALEDRVADVTGRLRIARQQEAHPISESLGETQTLARMLKTATDPGDVRVRLRAGLKRVVEKVYVLVVPTGFDRVAVVQVFFRDVPKARSYVIFYRRAGNRREAGWAVESFTDELSADALDLRNPDDVRDIETAVMDWRPKAIRPR